MQAKGYQQMTTNSTTPRFLVMTSSAKTSAKFGRYRNVAVVETDQTTPPKMISEHARGLVRIVWHSGARSMGKTERCAYRVALREAEEMAERLNARDALLHVRIAEIGQVRVASGVADALEGSERVLTDALARVGEAS
jgi:hypothetical protein